jgi:stalled ribosome rescue protein Dom34
MSAILVWVHTEHAKLFHLKPNSIHVETVRFQGPHHPTELQGKNHPKDQTDEESFYRQLAKNLAQKEEAKWLLMGPGLAAKHFFRFLETHHPLFSARVIGIERVDQMPDSEILSMGRQFLQQYYLYQGVAN